MSIGKVLLIIPFFLALESSRVFAATQRIQARPGPNFISVELNVGDNRLPELFPNAPVGTLIFKFDNSSGWSAAQMYEFGWSDLNFQLLPMEGAVVLLPPDSEMDTTLSGEPATGGPQIYRGYNLVSGAFVRTRPGGENDTIFWFNSATWTYGASTYDSLAAEWLPALPFSAGSALWYHAGSRTNDLQLPGPFPADAPVNPNGTFTNDSTAAYLNNFAPAFGVNQRVIEIACRASSGVKAQLNTESKSGTMAQRGRSGECPVQR